MTVFGTEMNLVTFVFVALETLMWFVQLVFYLIRPDDKSRLWYLILLSLLQVYNITSGLLPDPQYPIPIYVQNIIAYGSGFCMASFFPFYFYKAFDLKSLKFHAKWGVLIFLIAPYVIFFVFVYSITKDLKVVREYGLFIPFFYSLTLIWAITKAILPKYKSHRSVPEIVGVYFAVVPWTSLALVSYLDAGQVVEASVTNGGFLVISMLYIATTIKMHRSEYRDQVNHNIPKSQRIDEAALLYKLTKREKEVIGLIAEGKKSAEIAQILYISDRTVSTHVENIYKKVGASGKFELLKKLNLTLPD